MLLPRNFLDCRIISNNCLDQDAPLLQCTSPSGRFEASYIFSGKTAGAPRSYAANESIRAVQLRCPPRFVRHYPAIFTLTSKCLPGVNTSVFPGLHGGPRDEQQGDIRISKKPNKDELPIHKTHHHSTKKPSLVQQRCFGHRHHLLWHAMDFSCLGNL